MPVYAEARVNRRGDRPLIIVLAVAAVLAPLLTAGATALFFLSRQQDDRISSLRRDISTVRNANERLFGQLASETAAKNAAQARLAALQAQVEAASRQLQQTNARLAVAQRALRAQAQAARRARQRARASGAAPARSAGGAPPRAAASARYPVPLRRPAVAAPTRTAAAARLRPSRPVAGTSLPAAAPALRPLIPTLIAAVRDAGRGWGRGR